MQRRNVIGTVILVVLIAGVIIYYFTRPSESEIAAALRAEFSEGLERNDYAKLAKAANEFSVLRGRTLEPAATFEEMFPIGSTAAYPLTSLESPVPKIASTSKSEVTILCLSFSSSSIDITTLTSASMFCKAVRLVFASPLIESKSAKHSVVTLAPLLIR